MQSQLQNNLFSRFPLFFRQHKMTPQESCLAFGIETNDGWYNLIYLMCIGLEEKLKLNKFKQKYFLFKLELAESFRGLMTILIRQLDAPIEEVYQKRVNSKAKVSWKYYLNRVLEFLRGDTINIFNFTQIKEKYGTLCVYHTSSNLEVENWIYFIEHLSSIVCEVCGKEGKVQSGSWIRVLCESCKNKENS